MIIIRWVLTTLAGGVFLMLLTLFALASGTAGSQWLLKQLIDVSNAPVTLQGVHGNLLTGLRLESVSLLSPDRKNEWRLQGVSVLWNPVALTSRQIHLRSVSMQSLHYQSSANQPFSIEAFQLPAISLPWSIQLDRAEIQQLQFDTLSRSIQLDQFMLEATFVEDRLQVRQATAIINGHDLALNGQLIFAAPFTLDADLKIAQPAKHSNVELKLLGPLGSYRLSGAGNWRDPAYVPLDFLFEGEGSLSGVELSSLKFLTPGGEVAGGANIGWSQGLKFSVNLQGTGFDIGKVNPKMPGLVDASAELNWQAQQFNLQMELDGSLQGYPLQFVLTSSGNGQEFVVDGFKLLSGPNQLQLDATGDRTGLRQLKWRLDAPDLSTFHSAMAGSASGTGELNGNWQQLQGHIAMQGRQLRYGKNHIESLNIRLDPNEAGGSPENYQLRVEAIALRRDELSIDRFELVSQGSEKAQLGTLSVDFSPKDHYRSQLSLHKSDQQWQLSIYNSSLELAQWPLLSQPKVAILSLSLGEDDIQGHLSAYCLHGVEERICADASWLKGMRQAGLTLADIPMRRFQPWLPASEYSRSNLSGEMILMQSAQQLSLDAGLRLDASKQIQLELAMDNSLQLSGQIIADFDQIQWLAMFHDGLNQAQGRIEAGVDIAGTVLQPHVQGNIRLIDASVNLPATGVRLQDIQISAEILDMKNTKIRGEAASGQGRVAITGDAQWWPLAQRPFKTDVKANNFQLLNLPELELIAAADLQLAANEQGVMVDGELILDQLLMRLEDLSGQAVRVSEDAHIVGQGNSTENTPVLPLNARIDVSLGKDVRLQGMGLDVALAGDLLVSSSSGRPISANGKIDVISGRYTAYGQNLSLQQSHLLFNGPLDQPGLDLKAQRKLRDVTVGVMVRGTLQNPQSELFSNPDMPDSDVLSYLLTGRALNSADGDDGVLMLGALTQLGIKGSAGLIEKVRNSTGLSTFEIDTDDNKGETALKLGRYLTPQLYIQYVKSIFSDSSSVQARYDINDNLYIETQSGDDRSIDLKYQFER